MDVIVGRMNGCEHRAYRRFPHDHLDISLQINYRSVPGTRYDLAHVAGWALCDQHDLAYAFWVGSVLHRSCTPHHNGRLGSR